MASLGIHEIEKAKDDVQEPEPEPRVLFSSNQEPLNSLIHKYVNKFLFHQNSNNFNKCRTSAELSIPSILFFNITSKA